MNLYANNNNSYFLLHLYFIAIADFKINKKRKYKCNCITFLCRIMFLLYIDKIKNNLIFNWDY